jgi:hypothetical protein
MKVLIGNILVTVQTNISSDLILSEESRRGKVKLSGSSQIAEGVDVLFVDKFEEIQIGERKSSVKYYLMKEDNVKIVFGSETEPQANILPFLK